MKWKKSRSLRPNIPPGYSSVARQQINRWSAPPCAERSVKTLGRSVGTNQVDFASYGRHGAAYISMRSIQTDDGGIVKQ